MQKGMIKMASKILVLDVEGMSGKRPYDVGFLVADKKGEVFETFSGAVLPCVWENLSVTFVTSQEKAKVMTHRNIEEILRSPDKYKWGTIEEVLSTLDNTLAKYNISEIWAYNCSFDRAMIYSLVGENRDKYPHIMGVEWCDIWTAIVMTRCLTKKFVSFCRKNGFVTEKGNIRTSAEVVFAYLTRNVTFEEEHTGLSDCRIEYKILLSAIKSKKKMNGRICQPWKLVKEFVEREGL